MIQTFNSIFTLHTRKWGERRHFLAFYLYESVMHFLNQLILGSFMTIYNKEAVISFNKCIQFDLSLTCSADMYLQISFSQLCSLQIVWSDYIF